MTKLTAITRN